MCGSIVLCSHLLSAVLFLSHSLWGRGRPGFRKHLHCYHLTFTMSLTPYQDKEFSVLDLGQKTGRAAGVSCHDGGRENGFGGKHTQHTRGMV